MDIIMDSSKNITCANRHTTLQVVVILQGRYAGKKAVIVRSMHPIYFYEHK